MVFVGIGALLVPDEPIADELNALDPLVVLDVLDVDVVVVVDVDVLVSVVVADVEVVDSGTNTESTICPMVAGTGRLTKKASGSLQHDVLFELSLPQQYEPSLSLQAKSRIPPPGLTVVIH